MNKIIIALSVVGMLGFSSACTAQEAAATTTETKVEAKNHFTNLEQAMKVAKEQGKLLFVEFTGSDWCPPCQHLKKAVFPTKEFIDATKDKFVFVEFDFPRKDPALSKVSKEEREYRSEMMKKYPVRGFPTAIIMTADGLPLASIVGAAKDAAAYLERLETGAMAPIKKYNTLIEEAEKLEGLEKAKKLNAALDLVPEAYKPAQKHLIAQIIDLDKEDTIGLLAKIKNKQTFEKQTALFKEHIKMCKKLYSEKKLPEAIKYMDKIIADAEAEKYLPETMQMLYSLQKDNYSLLTPKDNEKVTYYATKALNAAPNTEMAKRLKLYIEYIEKMNNKREN